MAKKHQNWWGRPSRSKEEADEHREDEDSLIEYMND
jgi:hypothetical protein